MIVSLIVALGKNRELGLDNALPWHIPEDFKNFKRLTLGHHLVMGRKTFESLGGRPLPKRTIILLTRQRGASLPEILTAHSPEECLSLAKVRGETELFIAGGTAVYKAFYPLTKRIYLSLVDYSGAADTYFPDFPREDWAVQERRAYESQGEAPAWVFEMLERKGHN